MRVDIMTDIETLGTKPDSTVFQVSAIAFDITTKEQFSVFNEIIDIKYEKMIADGDTIKWWLNTDKELLHRLLCHENAKKGSIVFDEFQRWILTQTKNFKDIYLWGNGIKFDNVMIQSQMDKYGLTYPIFYQNDRDVRTILELASMKSGLTQKMIQESCKDKDEVLHNALDDCSFQVRMVCKCFDILMKGESK